MNKYTAIKVLSIKMLGVITRNKQKHIIIIQIGEIWQKNIAVIFIIVQYGAR